MGLFRHTDNDLAPVTSPVQYTGGNDKLFEKVTLTHLPDDAQLIVPDTHYAIVLKDGMMLDTLGGGRYDIFDERSKVRDDSAVVEVIYLSRTVRLAAKWGTQTGVLLRDTASDLMYHVGARGEYEVQIGDPRKVYLNLIGAEHAYTLQELTDRLLTRLSTAVENGLEVVLRTEGWPYDTYKAHAKEIGDSLLPQLKAALAEDYGLTLWSFAVVDIRVNDSDLARLEAARRERAEQVREQALREERKAEETARDDRRERERQRELDEARARRAEDWEREKYRLDLEARQQERYMDVTREIGWESRGGKAGGKFCPNCGAELTSDAKFCNNCGTQVSGKKTCPGCGAENPAGAKFCNGCGHAL